jgi:hypothetical protein
MELDSNLPAPQASGMSLDCVSEPIPSFALAWDPSIARPDILPEKYDTRISRSSIFYIPSSESYVVAQRCDNCTRLLQACDRALPACGRCVKTGRTCQTSSGEYVRLPGPKREKKVSQIMHGERPKRLLSEAAHVKRPGPLENKQKKQEAAGKSRCIRCI